MRGRAAVRARAAPDPSTVRFAGPWRHRDISANGIRLHVAEAGEGPLVLLLHGFGEFWWSWQHTLRVLPGAGYRVVAADLRGYGDSDKPPRGYDGWTLAGDVAGLIRALGEHDAHLVGHGWGGMLAWTLGALHPRLVRSVAAVSAAHPLALREEMRRTVLRGRGANQAWALRHVFAGQLPMWPERALASDGALALERLFDRWSGYEWTRSAEFGEVLAVHRCALLIPGVVHSALEYHRWAVRSVLRGDGRRFVGELDRRLRIPVLRVRGEEDRTVLAPAVRASANWCGPQSVHRELPGAGYLPNLETPAALATLLSAFLADVGGSQPDAR